MKKKNAASHNKPQKYLVGIFPRRVEIELASACNLRCTYCPRKYLQSLRGFMNPTLFKKTIDEVALYPETIVVLHRRGESLLHPDFVEICNYVRGKFRTIQLATNATLLDDIKSRAIIESIHFISFSIDVPEVFERTRVPAKYREVEDNILRFLALNKGRVQTQVSMVKTLEIPLDNVERFKKLWKEKVNRVRIYEEHSRNGRFGSLSGYRGERVPCVMPFCEMLLFCDGNVGRCNHDWDGVPMGDVNSFSIKEIWNSSSYEQLRKQHTTLTITDEICKSCDSWYPEIGEQRTGETVE